MAERIVNGPERPGFNPEELENVHHERSAELAAERDRKAHESESKNLEKSKQDALEAATKHEKVAKPEVAKLEKRRDTPAQRRTREKASFKATMKETQSQMTAPSRAFSKVIHNKGVEKTSEVVGSTVARPNAILAGSMTAFVFTLAIYLVARHYGYPLSGFETIAAFILGWVVGLLFDYLRVMVTGKKA